MKGRFTFRGRQAIGIWFIGTGILAGEALAQTPKQTPDVLIMVFATGTGGDNVSLTFGRLLSQTEAEALAQRLAKNGGWDLQDLSVRTNAALRQTTVTFRSAEVVMRDSGVLPVGAFVETYRDVNYIRLMFVIFGKFDLRMAWNEYEDENVRIRLSQKVSAQNSTYTFDIHILNHSGEFLAIGTGKSPSPVRARVLERRKAALLGLMALTCAVVALGVVTTVVITVWYRRERRRIDASAQKRREATH